MSALAVTHRREVDACPIKVETINIGCQIDGTGSRVRENTIFLSQPMCRCL